VRAGVSRGTVDRVLHDRPGVKTEVADRIREIADKMGFTPNRAGRILAARKQPISVGCLLPDIGNPFFKDVIAGFNHAQQELADFGVSVHIEHIEGFSAETHIHAIQQLAKSGYSGLCLTTMDSPEVQFAVQSVIQQGVPVVSVNTDIPDTGRICYVGRDYFNDGVTSAGLLWRMIKDPLRILVVTGSYHIRGHNERIRGFISGMKKHGMDFVVVDTLESLDSNDFAYNRTINSLRKYPDINCIFIAAAGVEGVCRAVKNVAPDFMHILAFDSVPETIQYVGDGTIDFTICQEPEQQGYMAINKLFNYLISGNSQKPDDFITGTIIKIAENIG
jgi:LacI family transcriptional regulator